MFLNKPLAAIAAQVHRVQQSGSELSKTGGVIRPRSVPVVASCVAQRNCATSEF